MSNSLGFAVASAAVLLVPGPTVVYVATRTARHGLAAGIASVAGVETGALLHVLATTFGLGAVVGQHEWVLRTIQYLGAAYLVYLGVHELVRVRRTKVAGHADPRTARPLPAAATAASSPAGGARGLMRHFGSGILIDLLNPKTTLFFLAFLPQFIDARAGAVPPQLLSLGLCFVGLAAVVDLSYALVVHALGRRTTRLPRNSDAPWKSRLTAGIYFGLGGIAVLA